MKTLCHIRFGIALLLICLSRGLHADELARLRLENWHQWRGPLASGEAPRGNPPTKFDGQTNIKWKVPIPGHGTSTPIVWGHRIFVLTAVKTERRAEPSTVDTARSPGVRVVAQRKEDTRPQRLQPSRDEGIDPSATRKGQTEPANAPDRGPGAGAGRGQRGPGWGFGRGRPDGFGGGAAPSNYYRFLVLCLDKHTGRTLWERIACEAVPHEGKHATGSFAPASPVTDGKYVYCSFGSRGIYCYDLEGNLQWHTDLGDMQTRHSFGEGCSPVVSQGILIMNWDHEADSFITALDANTGRERWRQDRDEPTTWNTPLVVEHAGRHQVVVNGTNRVRSYDLSTGERIWECGGQTVNPIPSPLSFEGLAICLSGFRGYAAYAIPLSATGDVSGSDTIAWSLDKGTPYVSSAVLLRDRLYFTKDRTGILTCIDARTGKILIEQKRLPALSDIYASPVSAAGRVYFSGRDGWVVVIDGTSDDARVLAQNDLGETIDASPAIVGEELFIRGEAHLYCIRER